MASNLLTDVAVQALVKRLTANLTLATRHRLTLADRRALPGNIADELRAEMDAAEWAAFDAAATLDEMGVGLSDRVHALLDRMRDRARSYEAEYSARYGDLGLSDSFKGDT